MTCAHGDYPTDHQTRTRFAVATFPEGPFCIADASMRAKSDALKFMMAVRYEENPCQCPCCVVLTAA